VVPLQPPAYVESKPREPGEILGAGTLGVYDREPHVAASSSRTGRQTWLVALIVLLVFQAIILNTAASQDVAPFPPLRFDQAAYLTEAYVAYERIRERGLIRGLVETLRERRAQGWLLQPEAATAFVLFGPSRMVALGLNFAYFLTYLAVTALVVRRSLGLPAALVALGIIVSAHTLNIGAGGAFDFRLDFIAMCIWGVLIGLLALGDHSQGKRLWLPVMLVGAWLILSRLVAATYVLPLVAALLGFTLLRFRGRRWRPDWPTARWLLLILGVWSVLLGGLFIRNYAPIASYYIRGHLTGAEKTIRAHDAGVYTLADSIAYYPTSALRDHLGRELLLLAAFALLGVLILMLAALSRIPTTFGAGDPSTRPPAWRWTFTVLGLGLMLPYVIMTLNEQKSPVAANVFVPTTALLVATVFRTIGSPRRMGRATYGSRAILALACAILALGLVFQLDRLSRPNFAPATRADLLAASQLAEDVGDYFYRNRANLPKPRWGTDAVMDVLASGTAEVLYYEKRGIWLGIVPGMGHAAIETSLTPEEVVAQAAECQVIVLTSVPSRRGPALYPLEQSLEAAKPQLLALAQQEFLPLGHYHMFGRDVSAFVRPPITVQGVTTDGWITRDGIDVTIGSDEAPRAKTLVLRGESNFSWLPAVPDVTATVQSSNGRNGALPARIDVSGSNYEIKVDLTTAQTPPGQRLTLDLDFSTSFIPRAQNISPDDRELVIMAPKQRNLELANPPASR
jgi:hypothetical protein